MCECEWVGGCECVCVCCIFSVLDPLTTGFQASLKPIIEDKIVVMDNRVYLYSPEYYGASFTTPVPFSPAAPGSGPAPWFSIEHFNMVPVNLKVGFTQQV